MRYALHGLVLPLAWLLAVSAQGQDDGGQGRSDAQRRRAVLVAEFDENGDGRLDGQEMAQVRAAAVQEARGGSGEARGPGRRIGRVGRRGAPPPGARRDGRGPLAQQGRAAANRSGRPSAERLLARFDADGDRELDLPELRRLVAQLQRLWWGGPLGPGARGGPPGGRPFGPFENRSGPPFGRLGAGARGTPGGFGDSPRFRRDPALRDRDRPGRDDDDPPRDGDADRTGQPRFDRPALQRDRRPNRPARTQDEEDEENEK